MESGETPLDLPVVEASASATIALVGNPNAGKTSLFNRLTGQQASTANYTGTTVSRRRGQLATEGVSTTLIDLPGLYSLQATSPEEEVVGATLRGEADGQPKPDGVVMVVDGTNLERNLALAIEVLSLGLPTLLAVNFTDEADRAGLKLDAEKLSARVGCPVVQVSARKGQGVDELQVAIQALAEHRPLPKLDAAACACTSCNGCGYASRFEWAAGVREETQSGDPDLLGRLTDKLDVVLTHRVGGLLAFAAIMYGTFMAIFSWAGVPMDWIDGLFGWAGESVGGLLPEGRFNSLVVDGLIGGLGGVVIFLPQICLLFFLLALLEDSGYLARAALVMDRLMQRVGLPGKAFVPMLSAHACAIPAIMATRVIDDRRDRLVTIMVAPLLTCSARLPVYVMVVAMLFPESGWRASLVFAGAYALGILAALGVAFVLKRTLLTGEPTPLVIELPNYRFPSIRDCLVRTASQAWAFLAGAGPTILVISLILWGLAVFPETQLTDLPEGRQAEIAALNASGEAEAAENLFAESRLERSLIGRIGQAVQPLFAPLGFDWKTTVGVGASFAAREVVVSTLSVLYGLGEEGDEESLLSSLRGAVDSAGEPVFNVPTCLSLLVFFVLAMQCLPTQAVTWRETGSWKWAAFQLIYMSVLAYGAAFLTYQIASWAVS